ncbi:hypothetical protein AnigIFM60653_007218 [Aspergillus niger]|nr:hypothetical protein AnigIFM60653_007218 [Aspergillus niger]
MESNSARSSRCLQAIRSRSGTKANVILLVGRLGAGKSTLTELITGAEGLSNGGIHSSTDLCQIFDTTINKEEYFIVDTPGFEPNNKGEIFLQVTEMLQQLRPNSIFGIWYLVNNYTRQDGFDREMVAWLTAFCGQSFCPNVTIVTTFWTGNGAMLRHQNDKLQQRLNGEWAQIRSWGAQHYAFGRNYVEGVPQESSISLFEPTQKEELEQQAKSMVTRYCHKESTIYPQILRELGEPRPLHGTSAGRIFLPPSQQAPRSASVQDTAASSSASVAEPHVPRQEKEETSWWSFTIEALRPVFVKGSNLAVDAAIGYFTRSPVVYGGPGGSNLDPLSSRDTAVKYGRSGDFDSRAGYYNSWGMNSQYGEFKGTAEQGDALRREMHKRWG